MKYINMGMLPAFFGFTTDEKVFSKEMRRLKVGNPPPFVGDGAHATTHIFDRPDVSEIVILVCMRKSRAHKIPQYALLVHEAVHVWGCVLKHMNAEWTGGEFDAYGIQFISQRMMEAL
jgi:hypothetical protein